jgi:hypothetical protein
MVFASDGGSTAGVTLQTTVSAVILQHRNHPVHSELLSNDHIRCQFHYTTNPAKFGTIHGLFDVANRLYLYLLNSVTDKGLRRFR